MSSIRLAIADFLNTKLLDTSFIFLNFWSIVHFFSGMLILFIGRFFKIDLINESPLLFLSAIIIIYEVIELTFINSGSSLFRAETGRDIIWDLILGFLGGYIYLRLSS